MSKAKPDAAARDKIEIPEQDVLVTLETPEEVLAWFERQVNFWDGLQQEIDWQ